MMTYETMDDSDRFVAMILIFCVFSVFYLLYRFIVYILQGIAFSKVSRKYNLNNPFMIWIPFARKWYIGYMASTQREKATDEVLFFNKAEIAVPCQLFYFSPFIAHFAFSVPVIGFLAMIYLYFYKFFIYHRIISMLKGKNPHDFHNGESIWGILSLFIEIVPVIHMLTVKVE